MILSNVEIHKAIDEGRLVVTPDPQPRNSGEDGCPYGTTALDLRLSRSLAIPKDGPYVFDLRKLCLKSPFFNDRRVGHKTAQKAQRIKTLRIASIAKIHLCLCVPLCGFKMTLRQRHLRKGGIAPFLAKISEKIEIPDAGYVLQPHTFVLGNTIEKVTLPLEGGLAARIEGKSSFARCGLLVHFTAPTVHAGFSGTLTLEMINLGNVGIALFEGLAVCQLILEEVLGAPQRHDSQFQYQTTPPGTANEI